MSNAEGVGGAEPVESIVDNLEEALQGQIAYLAGDTKRLSDAGLASEISSLHPRRSQSERELIEQAILKIRHPDLDW